MKFYNSLLLFCTLVLSQIFSVNALPINQKNSLEKRNIPPFQYLYSFVYFKKPNNWGNTIHAFIYQEGGDGMNWPGQEMTFKESDNFYHLAVENIYIFENDNLRIIFNDGTNQSPAKMEEGFPFVMDGVYDETGLIGVTNEKANPVDTTGPEHLYYSTGLVRVLYRPKENYFKSYDEIYAHYKVGNGNWNNIPGEKLTGFWGGFFYINVDLHDAEDLTIAFTDGEKWDNNDGKNYQFNRYSKTIIDKNN
eukprot:jgi/Orpsp1_1/1175431/evm.model.c7180000053826.1